MGHTLRLLALLLAAAWLAACGPSEKEKAELRVGLIMPLSGAWAGLEESQPRDAALFLVREANAQGGVPAGRGRARVTLLVRDSHDSVDKSLSAARDLINNHHVSAIIGPFLSRNAIAVAAEAESAHIPMVTPTSTHPATTRDRRWVFRVTVVDTYQGRALARFAFADLHLDTAAVLFDAANQYSSGLAEVFRDAFVALGGRVAAFESYVTGEEDFSRQLAAVRDSGAEVLFLPNFAPELERQVPLARELGAGRVYLGSDSWSTLRLRRNPAFQGCFYTADYPGPEGKRVAAEFTAEFAANSGADPSLSTVLTRDALALLFDAVGRAGSTAPQDIRQAIADTENFQGATGALSFPSGGDPEKSLAALRIENSQATLYKVLED